MVEQALRGWISSQGGYIHPDLHLFAEDLAKGRSVVTLKGISKGTQLMKIPTSISLVASPSRSARGGADSAGEPSLADFLNSQRKLTPFLRLVLTVLHEYSEGPASAIQPFIQSLPTSHNCVLGWTSMEKAALAGTTVEAEAATDIQATFHSIVHPIIRSRPELWKDEWATFQMFQRVCGVVQSRTFHLQEDNWLTGASTEGTDLYMIPGIDMVNHSTDPTARNTSLHRKELPEAQDTAIAGPMATAAPAAETLAPPAPVPEAPAVEAMVVDPPNAEAPAPVVSAAQAPATEAPAPEAPASDAPVAVAPAADALAAAAPPITEAAAAEAPAPMIPDSDVPAPATEAPPAPAPEAPTAEAPAAEAPASNGVATESFFVMEADADILSGSELLHSYGDLSDAELLNIFGFVDTMNANFTNPHNEVHLPTETLVALCQEQKSGRRLGKNFKRRKDFLKDIDMLPVGFPVTMQDPIPDSLVTVTQILLMSDMAEFDDLRLEIQKEKKKNGNTAVLGKDTLDDSEHSMFVCTNLLRTIEEQLASFPDIPPSVESGADPTRAAQAAHVRAGEKVIVQAQKKEVLQLMMNLDSDAEGDKDEEYF